MPGLHLPSPVFLGLFVCRALVSPVKLDCKPLSNHTFPLSGNFPQMETIFSFSQPSPPASWALPIGSIKQLTPLSGSYQDSWGPVEKKKEALSSGTQYPSLSKACPWHRVCHLLVDRTEGGHYATSPGGTAFPAFPCLSREGLWHQYKWWFRCFLILIPPSYLLSGCVCKLPLWVVPACFLLREIQPPSWQEPPRFPKGQQTFQGPGSRKREFPQWARMEISHKRLHHSGLHL